MNWTEVKIYTTTEGIEPLTGSLLSLGIQGFMIEDAQDFDEFLHDTTPHWDYIDQEVMKKMKNCESSVTLQIIRREWKNLPAQGRFWQDLNPKIRMENTADWKWKSKM